MENIIEVVLRLKKINEIRISLEAEARVQPCAADRRLGSRRWALIVR